VHLDKIKTANNNIKAVVAGRREADGSRHGDMVLEAYEGLREKAAQKEGRRMAFLGHG